MFRRHGPACRTANEAHLSLTQRRVMTAIEICRTDACKIACKNGSDSHSMMFTYGLILFAENQRHAIQLPEFILFSPWS